MKWRVYFISWLVSFGVLTLVNLLFHGVIAFSFFYGRLKGIIFSPGEVHSSYVALDYGLLTAANLFFILKIPGKDLVHQSAIVGGILGLISFGTWNLINYAFIPNWPMSIVIVDIPWHILAGILSGWVLGITLSWLKARPNI
jgi:uncharacterized membrane protein